mmetsp:Transcript_44063/g.95765  ORF Transcript_44063/g.95765 Transcript_44063/m.95765 type:complete len:81 (+) Transcript_44063:72-314(+)
MGCGASTQQGVSATTEPCAGAGKSQVAQEHDDWGLPSYQCGKEDQARRAFERRREQNVLMMIAHQKEMKTLQRSTSTLAT